MLPNTLEWWHVVFSILGIVFTIAVKSFGTAFRGWSDKLDSFQTSINMRLTRMEDDFASRMNQMESKFTRHEDRVHTLTLHVERRVTWIEAKLGADERRWVLPEEQGISSDKP